MILLAVGLVVAAVHVARDADDGCAGGIIRDRDHGGVPHAASYLPAIGESELDRARPIRLLAATGPITHEGVEGRVGGIGIDRGIVDAGRAGEGLEVEGLAGRMVNDLKVVGVSGNAVNHEAVRHAIAPIEIPAILRTEDTAAASHPAVVLPYAYWFG